MIKVVAFDFDGLLGDTEGLWLQAITAIHDEYHLPWSEEQQSKIFGKGTIEVAEIIANEIKVDKLIVYEEIKTLINELVSVSPFKMPGADKAIALFHQFPIALCSGSPRVTLQAFIENAGWKNIFSLILSCDDIVLGKPAPDIYQATCDRFNIFPHELLVFEDSLNGVCSALDCGAKVVAVPSNHLLLGNEVFKKAHIVLDSLEDANLELISIFN